MFGTAVKPENRLQMFPQILPKIKFENVSKTKESWKPQYKTCTKKRHKESVALLAGNLFCLHLVHKKGQSFVTVKTATMKNKITDIFFLFISTLKLHLRFEVQRKYSIAGTHVENYISPRFYATPKATLRMALCS